MSEIVSGMEKGRAVYEGYSRTRYKGEVRGTALKRAKILQLLRVWIGV